MKRILVLLVMSACLFNFAYAEKSGVWAGLNGGKNNESMQENVIPDGMIIDERKWEAWESSAVCTLYPFMLASNEVGFTFSIQDGANSGEKECDFFFFGWQ